MEKEKIEIEIGDTYTISAPYISGIANTCWDMKAETEEDVKNIKLYLDSPRHTVTKSENV